MSSPQRRHEAFFEQFIARALRAKVTHHDDGSAPGMVDALITYPDGATAALEVTTVANPTVMQMESFDIHIDIPRSPYWWDVRYPGPSLNQKELARHLPALIERLDQNDLDDAIKLETRGESTPDLDWYRKTDVRVRRVGLRDGGGRAAVLPDAIGGAVDEHLEGITEWLHSIKAEQWWTSNVGKLAASGYTELHLAVVLHESGVPFSLSSGFWDADTISAPPLTGFEPLSDVWLLAARGKYVARWSADRGWSSHPITAR